MRKTYQVCGYIIAALVVVQAMAIAFAIAGLGKWIEDGATVNKQVVDDHPSFTGSIGFPIHAIDGQMLIPLVTLIMIGVSFKAGVRGGTKLAAIIFGMIVVQVILGLASEDVPYLILLHVINAFGILAMAIVAARRAQLEAPVAVPAATTA